MFDDDFRDDLAGDLNNDPARTARTARAARAAHAAHDFPRDDSHRDDPLPQDLPDTCADLADLADACASSSSDTSPLPDLIPNLFPRRSLNLLVHLPFTGATRFLLPQLANYADQLPFLNLAPVSSPDQLGMILCARDPRDTRHRLHQLGLDRLLAPGVLPIVKRPVTTVSAEKGTRSGGSGGSAGSTSSHPSSPPDLSLCDISALYRMLLDRQAREWQFQCAHTPSTFPRPAAPRRPRFLIIESIHLLVPPTKLNDPHAVAELSNQLKQFCEDRDCTILGTLPISKTRGDASYKRLSEKIYGSIQWATAASSLLFFEEVDTYPVYRRVTLASKAARGPLAPLWATFNDVGALIIAPQPARPGDGKRAQLYAMLAEEPDETVRTRADFQSWGLQLAYSESTVDRWIAHAVKEGRLMRIGTGPTTAYQKARVN